MAWPQNLLLLGALEVPWGLEMAAGGVTQDRLSHPWFTHPDSSLGGLSCPLCI